MGTITATPHRGKQVFAFAYHDAWLQHRQALVLDPDLQLFSGRQYPPEKKANFGLFLDSSPDRWGRILMQRKEAADARAENRKARTLMETDYLLGVSDLQRMGGLRFKIQEEGPFLSDDQNKPVPPWAMLRNLEFASQQVETEGAEDQPEYMAWLEALIAPGSSLGGARPKAGVSDTDGHLWIAKFPSKHDRIDQGAWQMVVHNLALSAGIQVPEARIERFTGQHHTFLSKRFDRLDATTRLHYASAMTLLGRVDGDDALAGAGYIEMAGFIERHGASVDIDLKQLWKRIVFNICVSNADDHLRNHGFLLTETGWRLAPAFDMNPEPSATGLSLNITESDNALSLEVALEAAGFFKVAPDEAKATIQELASVVSNWHTEAKRLGLPRVEQELLAEAFRYKS